MAKVSTSKKAKRNWKEIEQAIAQGVLIVLENGIETDSIHWKDVSAVIGIDYFTVWRHVRDRQFFIRNYRRVAKDIAEQTASRKIPQTYMSVFFSCVSKYRIWFQIESLRRSQRLHDEVMAAMRPTITGNWPASAKAEALYRIIGSEIDFAIERLIKTDFSADQIAVSVSALTMLLNAYEAGRLNTSLLTYLQ